MVSDDPGYAARMLAVIGDFPLAVWGRDAYRAGEMWNSNSLVSWLLEECGTDAAVITAPRGGRAPGWYAGITVAWRSPCKFAESAKSRLMET